MRASADEHPDLFWAIRGGGGNFGVVTRSFISGRIRSAPSWQARPSGRSSSRQRSWPPIASFCRSAPRELTGLLRVPLRAAGAPFPEELRSRLVCGVVWNYLGTEEGLAKLLEPMLAVGTPVMHGVQPMPFAMLNGAFDALYPAGDQWYWRADFVKELSDESLERTPSSGTKLPTEKSTMHMYPIDGAAHDVGPTTRPGPTAMPTGGPSWSGSTRTRRKAICQCSVDYWEARASVLAGGGVREHDDGRGPGPRDRASYRGNYDRLRGSRQSTTPTTSSASTRTSSRARRSQRAAVRAIHGPPLSVEGVTTRGRVDVASRILPPAERSQGRTTPCSRIPLRLRPGRPREPEHVPRPLERVAVERRPRLVDSLGRPFTDDRDRPRRR